MTKAYWINTFTAVHDEDKLRAYIELAGPAMRDAGGRFLSRGNVVHAFEGATYGRTTLIEFPSTDAAAAAYSSPGYQAALEALGDGADREIRIVEALPDASTVEATDRRVFDPSPVPAWRASRPSDA